MYPRFTRINELLKAAKGKENQIELFSFLEQLGCEIPTGQETVDIFEVLTKAGRQDVIEAINKSGVLN
jgi:hypothetical protein